MNLIEQLETMARHAEYWRRAADLGAAEMDAQADHEAIETVRAMQEALRLAVEHFDTIYPTARGDDFLVDTCVEALRRAEGNAG
jgi:hypothetical protein